MNVDEMQAGRELDALIAKKIIGWRRTYQDGANLKGVHPSGEDLTAHVPSYSTNIAAAWRVVEKLDSKIALQAPGTTDMSEGYEYYKDWTVEIDGYQGRGDTAPLAICRAALKAVLNES